MSSFAPSFDTDQFRKMRTAICTISSKSHLFKAEVLFSSLRNRSTAEFFCLCIDQEAKSMDCVTMLKLADLQTPQSKQIIAKYKADKLRWACKPLILAHLLDLGFNKVIYVDNDIHFFSSPQFLFDELDVYDVALTPHYYKANATKEQYWLEANFRVGLFNAGFIGVNSNGISAMHWWADCCAYNIKKSTWRGLFDDQKYLDLMPVLFDNVRIIKHKGCNVAGWNLDLSPRSLNKSGEVTLDYQWPLIFIHFNRFTINQILIGKDPLLESHLSRYETKLKSLNSNYSIHDEAKRSIGDLILIFRHVAWHLNRVFD